MSDVVVVDGPESFLAALDRMDLLGESFPVFSGWPKFDVKVEGDRYEAREKAAIKAGADGDSDLAVLIRQFQFKDIRPKAASEIELTHASRLLGHTTEEMTKKVYRRVGEIVKPTK